MKTEDILRFKSIFGFQIPDLFGTLDIVKMDYELAKRDSQYDPDNCRYKDQQGVSMKSYIELKYGKEAAEFVDYLIKKYKPKF